MPYKDLKSALVKKLKLSPEAVSMRALRRKRKYGPMSTAQAYGVLGHEHGVDIDRYLAPSDVREVRQIMQQRALFDSAEMRKRTVSPTKTIVVRIGTDFQWEDPLLPERVLNDARAMADVYPYLYVFENSVREVIKRTLEKSQGENWWHACAPKDVRENVEDNKTKEQRNAWHSQRQAHEIYYTDISDLTRIITKNWPAFQPLFPNQGWVKQLVDVVAMSRHIVAHNNPLDKRDIVRIKVYFGDWSRQIQSVKHLLKP